jgi:4-amino-4-deoxy-L-arabinose transferase-like glycosyltransferase
MRLQLATRGPARLSALIASGSISLLVPPAIEATLGLRAAVCRRRRALLPLCVFFLALVPRLVFLVELRAAPTFDRPEGGDSILYDRLASGEPDVPRAYFHSPLYTWFLRGMYLGIGRDLVGVRLMQHLLGAACAVLIYVLTLRLFRRTWLAVGAALMWAFSGPAIFYEGQLLPDGILPFLVVLTALALIRHATLHTPKTGLVLGGALGVAALARPTILIWVPLALIGLALKHRRWLREEGAAILGLALVLSPATLHNYLVERDLVLITANTGINLYIGNNPNARGTYNLPEGLWFKAGDPLDDFSGIKAATRALGYTPRSSELSSWWTRKALAFLRENPRRGVELILSKLRLWSSNYEFPQLYNYYGYQQICAVLRILPTSGVILAPGLAGLLFVVWRGRQTRQRLYGGCVLCFAVGFLPFFVADRYRLPWLALLAPLAVWALASTVQWLRQGKKARAATLVAAMALAAAVSYWPLSEHPTLAPQLFAFGSAAEAKGELDQAVRWYGRTLAEESNHEPVRPRLVHVLLRQGRSSQALQVAREGIARFPRSGEMHQALGLVYQRQGALKDAEASVLSSIRLTPALASSWLLLGQITSARGDLGGAVEAFRSALTLAGPEEPWVPQARDQLRRLEEALRRRGRLGD